MEDILNISLSGFPEPILSKKGYLNDCGGLAIIYNADGIVLYSMRSYHIMSYVYSELEALKKAGGISVTIIKVHDWTKPALLTSLKEYR